MAARLGAGIALGLAAIHAQGIVHRDIKPDNILVGEDRRAKITDLGLAKQLDDPELNRLTGSGMVVGTPLYVSPEAIRDPQAITAKADIYSLGATLYHMLAGVPPFAGNTPYDVMRGHLEDRPKPIREIRPQVPAGLAQAVERCLGKAPEKRPEARELADQLGQGAGLGAASGRGLSLAMSLAALAVVGGSTLGWWALRRDPSPAVAVVQAPATVRIRANLPDLLVRVDGGPWQPLPAGGVGLAAGRHRLDVKADRPGPALLWSEDVELGPGQAVDREIALAPVALAPVREALPGDGMLYRDGVAFGVEPAVTVTAAGTYVVGRWDGATFASRELIVEANGQVTRGALIDADRPAGAAWFRTWDDDQAAIDAHHVLCWWEVDQARASRGLPGPPGWHAQGIRPEQPALRLGPGLVQAVLAWLPAGSGRLPTRALATRLGIAYRSPVWFRDDQGRLDVIGGGPGNALLIVVPDR